MATTNIAAPKVWVRLIKDSDGFRVVEIPASETNADALRYPPNAERVELRARPRARRDLVLGDITNDSVEVWADARFLSMLREFGRVTDAPDVRGLYRLEFNPRYDTGEVLDFLRRVGEGVQ